MCAPELLSLGSSVLIDRQTEQPTRESERVSFVGAKMREDRGTLSTLGNVLLPLLLLLLLLLLEWVAFF